MNFGSSQDMGETKTLSLSKAAGGSARSDRCCPSSGREGLRRAKEIDP
jgi:hypothetical protein